MSRELNIARRVRRQEKQIAITVNGSSQSSDLKIKRHGNYGRQYKRNGDLAHQVLLA